MEFLLILIGIVWLIYKFTEEKSWKTDAYKGKDIDVEKMFYDTNVKMTLGEMTKDEFKQNYKNGKYSK